jgi:hypothetical protein
VKAAVVAILLLLTAMPVSAQSGEGVITGLIVNKTSGAAQPQGANVTLVTFGRKEQAPLDQRTARTDAESRYTFSGLSRDPNLVYITVARYEGVNYPSETPFQLVDDATYQADISVYETTTADDALQLERLNMLVLGAEQGSLRLMQMGALVNSGDRTFVTANPQDQALARAVRFPLPRGAMGVQMQTGFNNQDLIGGPSGVQVTSPVLPGRHEFALSFELPYSGSSADLTLQLPYQTGTYNVYLPSTGIGLDTNSLAARGSSQLGGQVYSLYSASNLPRSALVPGQVTGLGASGIAPGQLTLIGLAVVLLVLGGGVVMLGVRGRRPSAAPADSKSLEQERLELVVRLASLDERFAAGSVSASEYTAERTRGKQRLRELLLAQRTETALSP